MFKIILLIVIAILAVIAAISDKFFNERAYKKDPMVRIRKIVKIRLICYIVIMVLILLLLFI